MQFLILTFFIFTSSVLFGQIVINEETHYCTVSDLDNYEQTISIEGKNDGEFSDQIGFPVNELAELLSFQLYERKGTDWKPSKLKKDITISTISRSSFFTGTKTYAFEIPAGIEFRLEFKTREKHTIFLSKCYRSGWFDAANVSYTFKLPADLQWTPRKGDIRDGNFTIDSSAYDTLESFPYLIHPKSVSPLQYFSSWFNERIEPQLVLDQAFIPESLTKIAETGSREELARACFRFVQMQIKYIDIENGIHAIIPRHCESVLKNGLGDCKDMATLLTALYRHFGFESYTGISRTNGKDDVFDFPSVALANHAICALHFEGNWYFLDATEDACLFEDPSIQLFGTELFLVGYSGNPFFSVGVAPRSKSGAMLQYRLSSETELELEMRTFGKMNHFLYYSQLKEKNPTDAIKNVLNQISGLMWNIDELTISDSVSFLRARVPLNSSMYSKMGTRTLYNLQFVPDLQMMSALFQNSRYPRFDGAINMRFDLGGTIKTAFASVDSSLIEMGVVDNQLFIHFNLQHEPNVDSFKSSNLFSAWKEFIEQPLLIDYAH